MAGKVSVYKVTTFHFSRLKRAELLTFNRLTLQIIDSTCGAATGVLLERFRAAAEAFDRAMHDKAFQPGLGLAEYDAAADASYAAVSAQARASLMHPYKNVRDAAQKVVEILDKHGNPTALPYSEEYGILGILLSQLKTLGKEVTDSAMIGPHVERLQHDYDAFMAANEHKVDVKSKQILGMIKDTAEACYESWGNLAKYLEVMAASDALPGAAEAIDKLNALLMPMKTRLKNRLSSQDAKEENVFDETTA